MAPRLAPTLAALIALCVAHSALSAPIPQALVPQTDGLRLIAFGEGADERVWMDAESVAALIAEGKEKEKENERRGFMDITEHSALRPQDASPSAASIPTAPRFEAVVRPLLPLLSIQRFNSSLTHLSSYRTRYYRDQTGVDAALWLAAQYTAIADANPNARVSVRTVKHTFVQPSVVARIEGDGSSDELVILGGHLDSISSGSTAPGADDDASGTSTVLEVFRVLVESGYKPKRPIEFHGYAGEEAGLLGSQDIAASYQKAGTKIASMMQLDMTCFPGTKGTRVIGVINDFVDPALTRFTEAIIDTYTGAPRTPYTCGYGCSDHASFHRAGFRASYPFEAPKGQMNPDIHTIRDTIDKCDFQHAETFLQIALAYVVEMSAASD
eukprot:TRINITY_DN147_c0_g1_i1.p1 TRINITY_DN147_c0_g1~~TRINITY_DN147_c0_g1_i1.p1  ORF type:complete len:384 (+),score=77.27 TRINITY_DN147_c0_g1_i1:67-1218(+)